MRAFPDLSDGQLAEQIVIWAGRIAAGEARLVALIAEGCREDRARFGGGRERVRVARALGPLPRLEEGFAAGRLSCSQLRAITRVATADDEQRWLDLARHSTAGQLERLVRGAPGAEGR